MIQRRFKAMLFTACALLFAQLAYGAGAVSPVTIPFDHLSTGFELDGVHRELPCESCHLNAIFKGTPRNCSTCHSQGSPYNATPKNRTHNPANNNCAACHNTIAFRPAVHFDHRAVLGGCSGCHNNVIAQGENPTHPATTRNCVACHSVVTWNPPTTIDPTQLLTVTASKLKSMSHAGVTANCVSCHDGVSAAGKRATHITSNSACQNCHVTSRWLPARFDHQGIMAPCASCHNGVVSAGKPARHIGTTQNCGVCHGTIAWHPARFTHQYASGTCFSCHNGVNAAGKQATHVATMQDCASCHGTLSWSVPRKNTAQPQPLKQRPP